jgi:asparagine synthase (glutamine-hydrolysing)
LGSNDSNLLQRMCEILRHRGPDETTSFVDDRVSLGSNRLSIIDIAKGHQPIHNEDQSLWLVFNGEIYNYLELRSELSQQGHVFYTDSDTETIVHGYEQWGDEVLQRLRGMFAFALWDSKRKRLFLARDRFGKKPLFYAIIGEKLFFASEMKALLLCEELKTTIDMESVDYFFTYGYIPSPRTIFAEIRKLPPAHSLSCGVGGWQINQYWDLASEQNQSAEAPLELLFNMLREASKIRLRSDVPIGLFLSGGVDSSVVAAMVKKELDQDLLAFSIGFGDPAIDETRYAAEVAENLGLRHEIKIVLPEDTVVALPKMTWQFDEPFADFSMFPTYFVSELARKKLKVVLSGDGGDEVFMGYNFLSDSPKYARYRSIPRPFSASLASLIAAFPSRGGMPAAARWAISRNYANLDEAGRFLARLSNFTGNELHALYESRSPVDTSKYLLGYLTAKDFPDFLAAADYATIKTYLAEDILVKVDRASMAASVEVRCPLLDQDLAQLVFGFPSSLKRVGNQGKLILKKLAAQRSLLPHSILDRPKRGFGPRLEKWLSGPMKDVCGHLLDDRALREVGFLDRSQVKRLANKPEEATNKIYALMEFSLWHQMFIMGNPADPKLDINSYL